MIGDGVDGLLMQAKKKKKVKIIPKAPRQKTELVKKTFKKNIEITKAMELYDFFKKIDDCPKIKEHEFRKNVRLKVTEKGQEIIIDLDKLKEYSKILDDYIDYIKHYILS